MKETCKRHCGKQLRVLMDSGYPLLLVAALLAWWFVYQKTPISLPTYFFSAGTTTPSRDQCWAETVVHPVLLWRMAMLNS